MKKLMMVAGTLAALGAWSASPVQGQGASTPAQDTKAAQGTKSAAATGKTMQLTGCLAKGADANSFVLNNAMASTGAGASAGAGASTGAGASAGKDASASAGHGDMKSYRVVAKEDLKLTGHVGHKVELTGQVDSSASGSGAASGTAAGSGGTAGSTKAGETGTAKSGAGASAGAAKSGAMPQLTVTAMKHIAPTCP